LVHDDVLEELGHLDRASRKRILAAIRALGQDPSRSAPGKDVRKLNTPTGRIPLYRLRIGAYRAIFAIEGETVWVTELVHRGQAYM
jgi:mRNA interferase RelE/StbE